MVDLSIIGTGYVGLVCGIGFAQMGNSVICVDTNPDKVKSFSNGELTIYEPGIEEIMHESLASGTLRFTTSIQEAVENTDICFIAVGTPSLPDGQADISQVLEVAGDIGRYMNRHMTIIDKSTVPVGTAKKVRACVAEELNRRKSNLTFDVVSNPEFLKEGVALSDFMSPDRVILGVENDESLAVMKELYSPFILNHDRFIVMDVCSAEMTKYAANAMLATKISFINEIANICERVGADVNKVRIGIGSDSRIGYNFLYAGCGYGGSCLPKDMQSLIHTAKAYGYRADLLQSIEDVNTRQKATIASKVIKRFGTDLKGVTLAVWGVSFKPGTDDVRESSSIYSIEKLSALGARFKLYDPKAMVNARENYLQSITEIEFCSDKYQAITDVDAMLLMTEWKEFRSPDFISMKRLMKSPVIFDGRNQYNDERLKELGFEYWRIGLGTPN